MGTSIIKSNEHRATIFNTNPFGLLNGHNKLKELVGETGFEPATSWSQTKRSSRAELLPVAINKQQHKLGTQKYIFASKMSIK